MGLLFHIAVPRQRGGGSEGFGVAEETQRKESSLAARTARSR